MISKKSNKADLEKKKPLFFEIGLTIALAALLVAFEWATIEKPKTNYLAYLSEPMIEELEIDITRIEKKEIKRPKAIQIEVIPNETEIPEPDFEIDNEINPGDGIVLPEYGPEEDPVEEEPTFIVVENMPEYRNGSLVNFHHHIQEIVNYPQTALDLGLEGTVIVSFVVNKRGYVSDIKILRGIDPLLDNEAIAAIEQSEKWKPGKQTGRAVNVAMVLPVTFRLQ